jgi:hypothetical protein
VARPPKDYDAAMRKLDREIARRTRPKRGEFPCRGCGTFLKAGTDCHVCGDSNVRVPMAKGGDDGEV